MQVPDVDLIVVCAHIAPQFGPELGQIYDAIRANHKETPLVMLSGHSHVTYFNQLDRNAFTIESGKYFEVIGVIKFDIWEDGNMHDLDTYWLETSVENFVELAETESRYFDTPQGLATSSMIQYYYDLLGLNITYGCAPETYYPDIEYSAPDNMYKLLVEEIVPKMVFDTSDGNTQFYITNTASLRYNLYAGPVTRNDIYTISPFNDTFVYYPSIPGPSLATLVQAISNTSGLTAKLKSSYCGTFQYYPTPSWYMSPIKIENSTTYDLLLATYDAETIYPVVQELFSGKTYSQDKTYPTQYNSTGVLQAYIETVWPCPLPKE